ncbi:calponin homology domain-containing protein [Umbelopsis sp. AD052]|nr:calponin homology domain-containing protein [Umbelopsis sp. AD052]
MGESRTELLAWLNDLLQLNYTKIEQAGSGAAYCQIMDSIFADVGMSKVKFDTKQEYEYVSNYKVLQHTFDKHKQGCPQIIPVDRLMKCKFQDNLEFMQWVKRFWDANFPGGAYDALARRKGGRAGGATSRAPTATGTRRPPVSTTAGRSASRTASGRMSSTGRQSSSSASANVLDNHSAAMIIDLNKQIAELKVTVDGLEKERDFYFGKLRDIEILIQEQLETNAAMEEPQEDPGVLKDIQAILYNTEEGFEVPPEGEEQDLAAGSIPAGDSEDETF